MRSAGAIVIPKLPMPERPLESLALTLKVEVPGAFGVPLTAPEVERLRPSGSPDPEKL